MKTTRSDVEKWLEHESERLGAESLSVIHAGWARETLYTIHKDNECVCASCYFDDAMKKLAEFNGRSDEDIRSELASIESRAKTLKAKLEGA